MQVRRVKREHLEETRVWHRDHGRRQYKVRTDRTAVDRPERERRFRVVYQRRSRKYATRRRVSVEVGERETRPSVSWRYASANWMERERWESFGVPLTGHGDRRRLLSDYGKEGHMRRKDYPLSGYTEVRYDEGTKRVVSEPVQRSQLR